MAAGIQFYQSKNYKGFEDCDQTIKFTLMMTSLFDALNRKFPDEGIKKNSSDYRLLDFMQINITDIRHILTTQRERSV